MKTKKNKVDSVSTPLIVVLTGGPCAGKTSVLSYLQQKLPEMGVHVFVVSEVATEFRLNGITPGNSNIPGELFQKNLLLHMIQKEDIWKECARYSNQKRKVLICDRGAMDGQAYVDKAEFERIVKSLGYTIPYLRDSRYDEVIHLKTVAIDKPEHYTLKNNKSRLETIDEAIELDKRILSAWIGAPKLKVINNQTSLRGKEKKVLQHICGALGIPVPLEIEKKFLVDVPRLADLPNDRQIIDIVQHYLESDPGVELRVRRRGQNGNWTYYHTIKSSLNPGVRTESERQITESEYFEYLHYQNPKTVPIVKKRVCFVYNDQYFELDIFKRPVNNRAYLEIELTDINSEVSLPPFINVIKSVTGEIEHSNGWIANIAA